MVAPAITAFCPTHNTGSNESTRGSGIGEFIVEVLSISTVLRNGHIVLNEQIGTLNYITYLLRLPVGKLWKAYAVTSCLYMQLLVDIIHNNFRYGRCVNTHPQTHRVMLEALPYFENRSLILVPNIRKRGHFFCLLLACCLSSPVYFAPVRKSYNLDLKILQFLVPEAMSIPKSIHVYKV